jgi:hypothetical protein
MNMELLPIVQMISLDGDPVLGAGPQSADAIEAKVQASSKPWCAVSGWLLIDVEGQVGAEPLPKPMLPLVMYAYCVHMHSSGRLGAGDSVLSGYATSLSHDGIFETAETLYLLLGNGFRKSAGARTVQEAQLRFPGSR